MPTETELQPLTELAARYGGYWPLYKLVLAGQLPVERRGKRIYVDPTVVARLVQRRSGQPSKGGAR